MKKYPYYTDIEKRILSIIGYTFLELNDLDYDVTYRILERLRITNINYNAVRHVKKILVKNTLTITLHRPGILIGSKGSTIEAIQKNIEEELGKKIRIDLKEDSIDTHLYPMHPDRLAELGRW